MEKNISKGWCSEKKTFWIILICSIFAVCMCGYFKYSFHMPKECLENSEKAEFCHISVDDTIVLFEDLTIHENEYTSIFDNSTLKYFKSLHDNYGAKVSFYVFYSWDDLSQGGFSLGDATDKFAKEFAENADWMKFGFHAMNVQSYQMTDIKSQQEYYDATVNELIRIIGGGTAIDRFVRLDRYSATNEVIKSLHELNHGIVGLYIADDENRISYGLDDTERQLCYTNDLYEDEFGVFYTPTDMRLEDISGNKDFYKKLISMDREKYQILFTHEFVINHQVEQYLEWFCMYAKEKGIPFSFPQENMEN